MKRWSVILLFAVLCFPASALDTCPECPRKPVRVDPAGWWLTGLLVGSLNSGEWVNGIFWSSGELGVKTTTAARYPALQYALSVNGRAKELWQKVKSINDSSRVVFTYRNKAFLSSPFSANSDLILLHVSNSVDNFFDSAIHRAYPQGADAGLQQGWLFDEQVARGLVTQVQRVNRVLLGNQCRIEVHLGGLRKVAQLRGDAKQMPNVGRFTTAFESLCRYAEVAAITGQEVNVLYSDASASSNALVRAELYKIWASEL